jgi:serine/threonine-protein kinase
LALAEAGARRSGWTSCGDRGLPAATPRVGRYELLLPLGAGGMGQVFVARQEAPDGLGRLVALKRVLPHLREDPEASARFLHEGRIGLRLHHPNLVTVYEFGRAPSGDYLAMELVRGG